MNTKKILIFLTISLIFILILFSIFRSGDSSQNDAAQNQEAAENEFIDEDLIVVISPNSFKYLYIQKNSQTLAETLEVNQCSFGINGGYFKGSYTNATPSGIHIIDGVKMSEVEDDQQLTSIAILNNEINDLSFLPVEDFVESDYNSEQYTIFQSGPMIVSDSEAAETDIQNSINGRGKYLRTFVGFIPSEKAYIYGITRKSMTLTDLAKSLLEHEELKGKNFSVINLDGGPSTAISSIDQVELEFNSEKVMPLAFCVD